MYLALVFEKNIFFIFLDFLIECPLSTLLLLLFVDSTETLYLALVFDLIFFYLS